MIALLVATLLAAAWYFFATEKELAEKDVDQESPQIVVPSEPEFLSLLPAEAYRLLQERDVVIVDVRTEAERAGMIIPGSISVPIRKLAAGQFDQPREQPLLLVCAVGGRSYGAGLYLMQQGYLQVYNLRGGINAWSKEGLPLEPGVTKSERATAESGSAAEK